MSLSHPTGAVDNSEPRENTQKNISNYLEEAGKME